MQTIRSVFAAILLLTINTIFVQAQDFSESIKLISRNQSFESGVGGWNNTQLSSKLLRRSESDGFLGSSYVQLKGVGTWGQTLTVPTGSKRHLLNAFAYKKAIQGTGSGGYASIVVSYYDAQWNSLDYVTIPIDGISSSGGDFNQYTWGIDVPAGAVNIFMFVYCSEGTEVNIDYFGLFDYKLINERPVAPTLIARPQFSNFFLTNGTSEAVGYGVEFWQTDFDITKGFDGLIGSTNQEESAYQFVQVTPGRVYSLYAFVDLFGPSVPAYFGIDFYDADWNPIEHFEMPLANGVVGRRLTVPAQTAYASVWVWCAQLPAGTNDFFLRPTMFLREQATGANANTSLSCIGTTLSAPRVGPIEGGLRVMYSDIDGINVSSIDANDAYFVSKSDPSKTYPVNVARTTTLDNGKLVMVQYLVSGLPFANYADFGSLVVKPSQVKDSKGRFFPGRTFSPINLRF